MLSRSHRQQSLTPLHGVQTDFHSAHDRRRTMKVSQRLQDFLTGFLAADEDLEETAQVIKSAPDSELARWLRPELDAAIRDQLLSTAEAEHLMSRRFDSPADVAHWLSG